MSLASIGRALFRINTSVFLSTIKRTMATGGVNRLGLEKSPYLLQHAENPVQWYPWGEEAFGAARESNKLIFLSVGYSTCHWCHVMERESFENSDIAKIMNEHFINIKVDREERPDVDKVYMTFVTASSGQGGWPMSVFLTPDLVPVAGGTYFPPTDSYGRPGFATLLTALASKWKTDQKKIKDSGVKIMEVLQKNAHLMAKSNVDLPSEEVFARGFTQLSRMYEPEYGGFGEAPKFPQPSNLNFLFTYKALNPFLDDAQTAMSMALHTLNMMDRGGIHDHVAQGFARYSTDKKWHVPHFEKMLYDQAQLVISYLDAFLLTKGEKYEVVVRDILTYVMRDLSHPEGGFYSAEDADSLPTFDSDKKREGAFCVWTYSEILQHLNEPLLEGSETKLYQLFNFHYSVLDGGNVDAHKDPHNELKNQNVLICHGSVEDTAVEFNLSVGQCKSLLKKCCQILLDVRMKRPKPHLDDKMLTAWNGMMMGATARAGAELNDNEYIKRAEQNANFIRKYMWKDEALLRAAYKGENDSISLGSEIKGFSDDYAWVIRGLYYLYNATLDDNWLKWAEELQDKQNELFWDSVGGGYFMTQDDQHILLKLKEDQDGAEPSVNSVSSGNLVRLSRLLNRSDYEDKAAAIFKLFSDRLEKVPAALPEMVTSLMLFRVPAEQIILAGDKTSTSVKDMLHAVHESYLNPNRIILIADKNQETSLLYLRNESLKKYLPKTSEGIAYLCKEFACSLPFKDPSQLREKMVSSCTMQM